MSDIGDGQGLNFRQIARGPFHGARTKGLYPYATVVFDDVAHHGHRGTNGGHVAGPIPTGFHHARAIINDGIHAVIARSIRVLNPRNEGTFNLDDLIFVFKQLADFNDLGFTNIGVPVEGRDEKHGQSEHDP